MSIPCENCAAPCCRNYRVGIQAYDAFRIAAALRMPMADFCDLTWSEQAGSEYRILLDASDARKQRRYYALSLSKVPDPDPRYRKRCVFLLSVGQRGRCGIYGARPGACRIYPTSLVHGVVGFDGGGQYCPPGSWLLQDIELVGARRKWAEHRALQQLDDALTEAWNGQVRPEEPRSEGDFFDYIATALTAMEDADPRRFHDPGGWAEGYARGAIARATPSVQGPSRDTG